MIGGDQMVQATSGLGFGASAVWIPNPDGSVDLKLPGHSKRLVDPGEGEFVGGAGRETIVLLSPSGAAEKERELPGELVVHVLEADRAIAELRLVAVSPAVDVERRVVTGRPVQVRDGRLYWLYLGPVPRGPLDGAARRRGEVTWRSSRPTRSCCVTCARATLRTW